MLYLISNRHASVLCVRESVLPNENRESKTKKVLEQYDTAEWVGVCKALHELRLCVQLESLDYLTSLTLYLTI